jgi:hypothetical protein
LRIPPPGSGDKCQAGHDVIVSTLGLVIASSPWLAGGTSSGGVISRLRQARKSAPIAVEVRVGEVGGRAAKSIRVK